MASNGFPPHNLLRAPHVLPADLNGYNTQRVEFHQEQGRFLPATWTKPPSHPSMLKFVDDPVQYPLLPETWAEPPLRTPEPSYMDYKGVERVGVLENMMPLGTLPTARIRTKAKAEPLRRTIQARNFAVGLASEELRSSPDHASVSNGSRAASMIVEEQVIDPRLADAETENPTFTAEQATVSWQQYGDSPLLLLPPTSRDITPAPHLRQSLGSPSESGSPFNKALQIANRSSEPEVGQAIIAIHHEVQQDPELTNILAALTGNKSNPEHIHLLHKKLGKIKKRMKSRSPRSQGIHSSIGSSQPIVRLSNSPHETARNTIAPATHKELQQTESFILTTTPSSQLSSPSKLSIVNRTSPRDETNPANGIDGSLAADAEMSERVSRASTTSLSSVDENVIAKGLTSDGDPLHGELRESIQRSSEEAGHFIESDDNEELETRRKRMKRNFDDINVRESYIRPLVKPLKNGASANRSTSATPTSSMRLQSGSMHLQKSASNHTAFSPVSNASGSRVQEIPPTTNLGRPPKRSRATAGAKIKMSGRPVKNRKSAVIAGIARPEGRRHGSVGYDAQSEQSDNNDYCSACGGSGFLLCCDGCDRSFHFTCLDPPLDQHSSLDEPWYCYVCQSRRDPPTRQPQGLFASLTQNIEKKNPTSFFLPDDIRDYFEGVRTGDDGEYVESSVQKASIRTRVGYDDVPDWKRTLDSKGNAILCFACGKSSGGRDIISCDHCALHWHLDCLNPPLSIPPNRGGVNGKPRVTWMCPNHVEQCFKEIDPLATSGQNQDSVRRTHKVRRPRNAIVVDSALRRGFVNNGLIEVADDPIDESDFTDQEGVDGSVVRVPARGIKLDFIDKVKCSHMEATQAAIAEAARLRLEIARITARNQAMELEYRRQMNEDLHARSLKEQQAAFWLQQFRDNNTHLRLADDELDNLLWTAIAEAPQAVLSVEAEDMKSTALVSRMATASKRNSGPTLRRRNPPSPLRSADQHDLPASVPLSERERKVLERLQETLRKRLEDDSRSRS